MNNPNQPYTTGILAVDKLRALETELFYAPTKEDKRARFRAGLYETNALSVLDKDFLIDVNWLLAEEKTMNPDCLHALGRGVIVGTVTDVTYLYVPDEALMVVSLKIPNAKFMPEDGIPIPQKNLAFHVPVGSVQSALCLSF